MIMPKTIFANFEDSLLILHDINLVIVIDCVLKVIVFKTAFKMLGTEMWIMAKTIFENSGNFISDSTRHKSLKLCVWLRSSFKLLCCIY